VHGKCKAADSMGILSLYTMSRYLEREMKFLSRAIREGQVGEGEMRVSRGRGTSLCCQEDVRVGERNYRDCVSKFDTVQIVTSRNRRSTYQDLSLEAMAAAWMPCLSTRDGQPAALPKLNIKTGGSYQQQGREGISET
jgi:hypothetical protein